MIIFFSSFLYSKNLGHRLGGDIYEPENTLFSYKKALKELQKKEDFLYVEFDIRESKDGKIVVFHDSKIARMTPQSRENMDVLSRILKKKRFEKIRIKDLTFNEIVGLSLKKETKIPTLKEVLDASIQWNLKKPMHIEVKSLMTDQARYHLIQLIQKYASELDISLVAFQKNFAKSFPFPPRWIKLLQNANIEAYQIDKHSFTVDNRLSFGESNFKVLLSEKRFFIKKETQRVKNFSFNIPNKYRIKPLLQVGIYGGADDSGDHGVTFTLRTQNGKKLLSGFSSASGWEWFSVAFGDQDRLILSIKDKDTKITGKKRGNSGMVKVLYR